MWFKLALTAFCLVLCNFLSAQVTFRVQESPRFYTPLHDTVFVAGDFNNWNPSDPNFALTDQGNGVFELVTNLNPGSSLEYKYVRGAWGKVETLANGSFRPNRLATAQNGLVLSDTVAHWEDLKIGNHLISGHVFLLDTDFDIPQLGRKRMVWIWLPPDYFVSSQDYPVMYMHDGQNLFDPVYGFLGNEWEIDESMSLLMAQGERPVILVGINNGEASRIDEYSPWTHLQYGGGEGDQYLEFVFNTLKPWIDNHYRTLPGRESTGLLGSSLGGLISHYGAMKYQNKVSRAGIFSPSYWFADEVYTHTLQTGRQQDMRLYLLAGGQESSSMVPNVLRMQDSLFTAGFSTSEVKTEIKNDGEHAEWFWAREYADAYRWLWDQTTDRQEVKKPDLKFYPNPARTEFRVSLKSAEATDYELWNVAGQRLAAGAVEQGVIRVEGLPSGPYWVRVLTDSGEVWGKLMVE